MNWYFTYGIDTGAAAGDFFGPTPIPSGFADEDSGMHIVPFDGVIDRVDLYVKGPGTVNAQVDAVVRKNIASTGLVVSILNGESTGSGDPANGFAVQKGDQVALMLTSATAGGQMLQGIITLKR